MTTPDLAAHDALRDLVGRLGEELWRVLEDCGHFEDGGPHMLLGDDLRTLIAEAEAVMGKGEK